MANILKFILLSYKNIYQVIKYLNYILDSQNIMNNWLNCDISPLSKDVIFTDVSKRFPFDDNFFDYIYSEHMIEHITFEEGLLSKK